MDEVLKKIEEQNKKIDAIYVSVEKTRKYFQWTFIVTVVLVVLPMLALVFVIPWFISAMQGAYSGLGL